MSQIPWWVMAEKDRIPISRPIGDQLEGDEVEMSDLLAAEEDIDLLTSLNKRWMRL